MLALYASGEHLIVRDAVDTSPLGIRSRLGHVRASKSRLAGHLNAEDKTKEFCNGFLNTFYNVRLIWNFDSYPAALRN